mmetsp:Transcript_54126/g.155462  ORF Transcript_54126/g.155462 Transcript_54126/m.155462 type:complete len:140 (+) Transcript_54126:975-1394(+)
MEPGRQLACSAHPCSCSGGLPSTGSEREAFKEQILSLLAALAGTQFRMYRRTFQDLRSFLLYMKTVGYDMEGAVGQMSAQMLGPRTAATKRYMCHTFQVGISMHDVPMYSLRAWRVDLASFFAGDDSRRSQRCGRCVVD